jgi:hypothetical protein
MSTSSVVFFLAWVPVRVLRRGQENTDTRSMYCAAPISEEGHRPIQSLCCVCILVHRYSSLSCVLLQNDTSILLLCGLGKGRRYSWYSHSFCCGFPSKGMSVFSHAYCPRNRQRDFLILLCSRRRAFYFFAVCSVILVLTPCAEYSWRRLPPDQGGWGGQAGEAPRAPLPGIWSTGSSVGQTRQNKFQGAFKGTVPRDFRIRIRIRSSFPKPLSLPLRPFQFFLKNLGDIRSYRCTTGVVSLSPVANGKNLQPEKF